MLYQVRIDRILALCREFNPDLEWPGTFEEISRAIRTRDFLSKPLLYSGSPDEYQDHVRRIAWLVVHGWNDAIEIDVGAPDLGWIVPWPLTDGNHRLAAARYRGATTILCSVGGQVDYAERMLGPW